MKRILILLLLLTACTIKEDPVENGEDLIPEDPEIVRGDYDDFVILKKDIHFDDYDMIVQDYYSNSLALYKNESLVSFYDTHGNNLVNEGSICSLSLKDFYATFKNPADPSNLTLTCDGMRYLYAYSDDYKFIYYVGESLPDYNVGLINTIRMLYILKDSPVIKEVDVNNYLHRSINDPLVITEYKQFSAEGILPVYELNQEPVLEDDVLTFDLTGKVGFATAESSRADILATLKFDGIGADTSTLDGLVTVVVDENIGLADLQGNLVIEPIYEPIKPLKSQLFSDNFQIKQKGPKVKVLDLNHYIFDYWTRSYFTSTSSNASGFRPVKKDGKVGFLDENGMELDSFYFDDAYISITNRAWVKWNGSWALIELGKDIGYQQQALLDSFNQEPAEAKRLSETKDLCESPYLLYEVNSETGLYIRDGADLNSGYLGVFNYQQKVCGIKEGDWVKFNYGSIEAYLYSDYMSLVNP